MCRQPFGELRAEAIRNLEVGPLRPLAQDDKRLKRLDAAVLVHGVPPRRGPRAEPTPPRPRRCAAEPDSPAQRLSKNSRRSEMAEVPGLIRTPPSRRKKARLFASAIWYPGLTLAGDHTRRARLTQRPPPSSTTMMRTRLGKADWHRRTLPVCRTMRTTLPTVASVSPAYPRPRAGETICSPVTSWRDASPARKHLQRACCCRSGARPAHSRNLAPIPIDALDSTALYKRAGFPTILSEAEDRTARHQTQIGIHHDTSNEYTPVRKILPR